MHARGCWSAAAQAVAAIKCVAGYLFIRYGIIHNNNIFYYAAMNDIRMNEYLTVFLLC